MKDFSVNSPSDFIRKESQLTKFPLGFPVSVHHRFEIRNQVIDVKDGGSHDESFLMNLNLLPETTV
jgi:hypothetical protein